MAEHETIADIIAEARDKYTVHECNQCAWRKCCSKGFGSEACGKFRESIWLKMGIEDGYFTQLLDRLDAARERERGDCAKLREALKLCMDEMCNRCRDLASARGNPLPCLQGCEPVRKAKAALAAPPRNCDRFKDALDAWDAYDAWVDSYRAQGKTEPFNEFGWLFAPYEEGGAK